MRRAFERPGRDRVIVRNERTLAVEQMRLETGGTESGSLFLRAASSGDLPTQCPDPSSQRLRV